MASWKSTKNFATNLSDTTSTTLSWHIPHCLTPTTGMSDIQPVSLYLPQGYLIFSQCPCTYHRDVWYSASVRVPTTRMPDIQLVSLYLPQGCLIFSQCPCTYHRDVWYSATECPCTYHRDVWYSASVPVPTTGMSDIQPVSLYLPQGCLIFSQCPCIIWHSWL